MPQAKTQASADKDTTAAESISTGEKVRKTIDSADILKSIDEEKIMNMPRKYVVIGVYVLLVTLGVGTGYMLSQGTPLGGQKVTMTKSDKVAGVTDTKTFKDSAVGTIEKGGIDGEGTHKLIREGGPSQTAYLLSSVVDLDQYVGKKVKVWGQTIDAVKAAWLMDVGRIEVQQ